MKTRSPGGSVGRRPRCRRATLPNMRIPAATFLAAVVLLTAGCGGDEGAENTSGGKPASAGLPTGTVSLATVTDENVEQACVTLFGDVADIGRFFSEAEYTWEASVFNEDYFSLSCWATQVGTKPDDSPMRFRVSKGAESPEVSITIDGDGVALPNAAKARGAELAASAKSRLKP